MGTQPTPSRETPFSDRLKLLGTGQAAMARAGSRKPHRWRRRTQAAAGQGRPLPLFNFQWGAAAGDQCRQRIKALSLVMLSYKPSANPSGLPICVPLPCKSRLAYTLALKGRCFFLVACFFQDSHTGSGTPMWNCDTLSGLQCLVKGLGSPLKRTGSRDRAESGLYGSSFFFPRRVEVGSV